LGWFLREHIDHQSACFSFSLNWIERRRTGLGTLGRGNQRQQNQEHSRKMTNDE